MISKIEKFTGKKAAAHSQTEKIILTSKKIIKEIADSLFGKKRFPIEKDYFQKVSEKILEKNGEMDHSLVEEYAKVAGDLVAQLFLNRYNINLGMRDNNPKLALEDTFTPNIIFSIKRVIEEDQNTNIGDAIISVIGNHAEELFKKRLFFELNDA